MPCLATSLAEGELPSTASFSVRARAEPGVMPRLLELFAKRGLVPAAFHSATLGPRHDELTVDIEMRGLDGAQTDYIAACMRQITAVEVVLTQQAWRAVDA